MREKILSLTLLFFAFTIQAQIVAIPDVTFKDALVNSLCVDTTGNGVYDSDVDTNNDGEIQLSEAQAVLRLHVANKSIKSLQGIEAFTELKILNTGQNQLTDIDLSKNTKLVNLFVNDNALTEIDLSKNLSLVILNCWGNQLSNLEVSMLKSLSILYCSSNKLTSLDVSKNPKLIALFCFLNDLSSLNLKNGQNKLLSTVMANLNPKLQCIQVDDSQIATENSNWLKDNATLYQQDCSTLSIDPYEINNSIKITPNPVSDLLTIHTNDIEKVEIFDIQGALILSKKTKQQQLDLSFLKKGIYFLKLKASNQLYSKKIIKQ